MNRITSTITYGSRVDYNDQSKWQRDSHPWTVELRYQRRKMTVDFWTGSHFGEPTTADVVECLMSDSMGYESEAGDFVSWVESYGYDDLREAERTFRAVEKQAKALTKLLGGSVWDAIEGHESTEDWTALHCR